LLYSVLINYCSTRPTGSVTIFPGG